MHSCISLMFSHKLYFKFEFYEDFAKCPSYRNLMQRNHGLRRVLPKNVHDFVDHISNAKFILNISLLPHYNDCSKLQSSLNHKYNFLLFDSYDPHLVWFLSCAHIFWISSEFQHP